MTRERKLQVVVPNDIEIQNIFVFAEQKVENEDAEESAAVDKILQ